MKKQVGGKNLNIEQTICQNALQLLVNQNNPALFDNPEVFEKNLIENGASESEELTALKQSLINRVPWEVRKQSKNLSLSAINELASNFSSKSNIDKELATWVINAWIAVLGLKALTEQNTQIKQSIPSPNKETNQTNNIQNTSIQAKASNSQPQNNTQVKMIDALPFEKIKGRLGIVFGEDNSGDVKVFNTWYSKSSSEESSSLVATPVKIEATPEKPFKTAPIKRKEKFVNPPKQKTAKNDVYTQNNTNTSSEAIKKEQNSYYSKEEVKTSPIQNDYKPSVLEQKAYDLINKGTLYVNDALKILAPIAVAGSVLACRKMGEIYYRGFGVVQNFQAAHAWLKLSAEKDDPESLFMMGSMYQFGMGVKQDMVEAKQFFERAARQGHSKSIESLKIIQMGL